MNYCERHIELNNSFRQGVDCHLEKSGVDIRFFRFHSLSCDGKKRSIFNRYNTHPYRENELPNANGKLANAFINKAYIDKTSPHSDFKLTPTDDSIVENFSFEYPVFTPSGKQKQGEAILLLHGLNERNWSKYLTWAEFLCSNTGKPVLLFPIAFHINRAPGTWSNPRNLVNLLNFRKEKYTNDRTISFANVALSDRISQSPERFYLSGRQTWADLTVLFEEIKTGRHPLFKEDAKIDIFAYSIGAFLSQVALMANQKGLFADSRLFMFCGGSIFRSMFGISRSILDKPAFEKLQQYYIHIFGYESLPVWERDNAFNAFRQMITPERFRQERETFFNRFKEKIKGIALSNDLVIPYNGVLEALGKKTAESNIQLLDFPFPYTHENPFPHTSKDTTSLNNAFTNVFSQAVEFLA